MRKHANYNGIEKRRAVGGFTLVEMLMAVLIFAMLTAMVAVTTTVAMETRSAMIEEGTCQTLASTAIISIADEVRFGRKIQFETNPASGETTMIFDSEKFGKEAKFILTTDGKIQVDAVNPDPPASGSDRIQYELLPAKTYGSLKIKDLKFDMAASGSAIKITLTVEDPKDSTKDRYTAELTVNPMNGAVS